MATTGAFIKIITFFTIFHSISGLYEDQVGTFDWRQQYIGKVDHLFWEGEAGKSGGKRLYVATDKNVLAAINTANGALSWRKVFEEGHRGRIDDMSYNTEVIVCVLGGRRVSAWNPVSGNLHWEVYLPGDVNHRAVTSFAGDKSKGQGGVVVVQTATGVFGLSLKNGEQKWDVELPNRDAVSYKKLHIHDGTIYAVGMADGMEVKVVAMDMDGTTFSTKSVLAGWINKNTRCEVVQSQYLLCYCGSSQSFQVLDLKSPSSFVATSVQDFGVTQDSVQVDNWLGQIGSLSGHVLVKLTPDHSILLTVGASGHLSVKKNLPKVISAGVVVYDDREYLLSMTHSGHEELTLTAVDIATGDELGEMNHKIHYATHNGRPYQISGLLAKKKDGRMAYKLVILSDDFSVLLIHKNGKVAWRREESLAYSVAVEMVDLPVSENQAKFEDEFGSVEDNIVTMFVKRIRTQLSQLQTFFAQQIHRLQGVRHHSIIEEDDESEGEEEEDFLRDEFNLHKMVIIVTGSGKVIGMRSRNGHIVWQHLIPELSPFTKFGKEKYLLYTQRTTSHFPHPPQCVVLGRNKRTGRGHLYAFNPITGNPIEGMPGTGVHKPYNVQQAFMFGEMDEHFLRAVLMVDENLQIHVYPKTSLPFVRERSASLYFYIADTDASVLSGYRIVAGDTMLMADNVWTVNLNQKQQKITNIVGKRANEHVHSQGRVLGDRSVLYKYINPNVVVVTAEGEDPPSTQQKDLHFINVYMIDVVTGLIVFHGNHRKSKGPISVVHSENWAVYNYYNTKIRRHEMAVLEMYEGKEQSNSTAFSSFAAPTQPLTLRQSFIFPMPLGTMATTLTEKGITSKYVLVGLRSGGLLAMPKAFLDPRRPLIPTQETAEEGTLPYIPELPVATEAILNYNLTLAQIQGIYTAPAGLESTSLVLAYGLDMYHTRVQPSKMFDVLKEDFEYWLIGCVVGVMLLVSFITQKLAGRKALSRAWK